MFLLVIVADLPGGRANHSNFDINAEENHFSGLNFSALDNLAGYRDDLEEEETLGRLGEMENQTTRQDDNDASGGEISSGNHSDPQAIGTEGS